MLTKDQLIGLFRQETEVCKHLHSKLGGDVDQRLGENMRSTIELMRYLACCGIVPAQSMMKGDWSGAGDAIKEMDSMTADTFPAAMDAQLTALEGVLEDHSEEELTSKTVKLPWGTEVTLGEGLVATSLRFLTAYRMQFFIHLKVGGRTELSTMNCWMGQDSPPA